MSTRLLSSKDVADRLQVNIRTAQKIIRSIPHVNIGTGKKYEHLRVTEEMLEVYISERTVMPCSPRLSRMKSSSRPQIPVAAVARIPRRPPD